MTKVNFINNSRIIVFNDDDKAATLDPFNLPEVILKTIDYCISIRDTVLKVYIHIDTKLNDVLVNVVTWDGCCVLRKSVHLDGETGAFVSDYIITDSI